MFLYLTDSALKSALLSQASLGKLAALDRRRVRLFTLLGRSYVQRI
jgi:hypothetical protein